MLTELTDSDPLWSIEIGKGATMPTTTNVLRTAPFSNGQINFYIRELIVLIYFSYAKHPYHFNWRDY
jgi:hypothetical protein